MHLPAKQALVCWLSSTVLLVGALLFFLGLPSADGGIEAITLLTLKTGMPALFSWLWVRKRTPPCSWGNFILRYIGCFLLLAFILAFNQISNKTSTRTKPTQQQIEKTLISAAELINARAPLMLDEETRLDKAVVGPGGRLTFFYSLLSHSSHELDSDVFLENLIPEMKEKTCSQKEIKPALQNGGVYVFAFAGNDGVEIARIELSKADCGY
ncbi:MAG: hypothetical protein FWG75_01750 [Cystobacterineae bacterium]|nr:hypothetical protein [Cystobacterineae bacterium]